METPSHNITSLSNEPPSKEGISLEAEDRNQGLHVSDIGTLSRRRRPRSLPFPKTTKLIEERARRYIKSLDPTQEESILDLTRKDTTTLDPTRKDTVRRSNLTRTREYNCEELEHETRLAYLCQLRNLEKSKRNDHVLKGSQARLQEESQQGSEAETADSHFERREDSADNGWAADIFVHANPS
jgi:hypothetical protein